MAVVVKYVRSVVSIYELHAWLALGSGAKLRALIALTLPVRQQLVRAHCKGIAAIQHPFGIPLTFPLHITP